MASFSAAASVEDEELLKAIEESRREYEESQGSKLHEAMFTLGEDILEITTLNQFGAVFHPLIERYQAPSAICGMTSLAGARYVAERLNALEASEEGALHRPLTREVLEGMERGLKDVASMTPLIEDVMRFVHSTRRDYIKAHRGDFTSTRGLADYMKAWVANYEISDYLRAAAKDEKIDTRRIFFCRFNQWPERHSATHEEWHRLKEEERFGGVVDHATGTVAYAPGEEAFFVERYMPDRRYLSPPEWRAQYGAEADKCPPPRVWVIDTNGHFVCGLEATVEAGDGSWVRRLMVYNTMPGNCLASPIFQLMHDLLWRVEGGRQRADGE